MIRYTLDGETRTKMASNPRLVQSAIAIEANSQMGFPVIQAEFIGKAEGGVKVNGCEICIKFDFLCDDWKRTSYNNPTPEEIATVKAIEIVADIVRKSGPNALQAKYPQELPRYGDQLRSMLG